MSLSVFFNKIVCVITLLAAAAFYNSAVLADDTAKPKTSPPPKMEKPAQGEPVLSAEQQATFRKITKDMYESSRGCKELRDEIRELSRSDAYDEKKIRALIQKRHKEEEERLVKSSKEIHAFHKALTPEQKKQIDAMHKQMKERRRDDRMQDKKEVSEKPSGKAPNKE